MCIGILLLNFSVVLIFKEMFLRFVSIYLIYYLFYFFFRYKLINDIVLLSVFVNIIV